MTLSRSLMFVLALLGVAALMTGPAWAAPEKGTRKCSDGIDNDGDGLIDAADPDCSGDPANPPFVATHVAAVGHELDCLECALPTQCASGDFFDVGTEFGCELLQCAVTATGRVNCGHTSDYTDEPQPRVDISGLFHLWDDDPQSQGTPDECFGNGIVEPIVSVGPVSGGHGAFNVRLQAFQEEVDGTLAGCEGDPTEVGYAAGVTPCYHSGDPFPPGAGEVAVITCDAFLTEARLRPKGGGGIAKKCGCSASGLLRETTVIRIEGLP